MSPNGQRVRHPSRAGDGSKILDELAAFLLFALTLFAYANVLSFFFTGRDAISFVAEGRIEHLSELVSYFTRRQFSGSSFPGTFYRPVTSLSFTLDYALWGLDPGGYHLTDLFIHATVGILTYLLGRRLLMLSRWASFLGAALFVLHPTHQGTVPVIARRIDPVATLFAFLTVLLFISANGTRARGGAKEIAPDQHRSVTRQALRVGSWIAYALALLSKETAIVVPAVLAVHVAGQRREPRRMARWLSAMVAVIPFLVITLAYLAVRILVLGGLGGYPDRQVLALDPVRWLDLTRGYLTLLLNPLPYWLHSFLTGSSSYRNFTENAAGDAVALMTALLIATAAYVRPRFAGGRLGRDAPGVVWITLQLALLLAVQTLTTQHGYVALAWLGLLLAGLIEDGWVLVQPASLDSRGQPIFELPHPPVVRVVGLVALAWASLLALVILRASPLFERPVAWRDTGESQRKFLTMLEDKLAGVPDGTSVELINLPFVHQSRVQHGPLRAARLYVHRTPPLARCSAVPYQVSRRPTGALMSGNHVHFPVGPMNTYVLRDSYAIIFLL
jgi:hypothetical protein